MKTLLDLAQTAERGKFDAFFLADGVAISTPSLAHALPFGSLEPLVLLAAISQVTERIGLIGSASTTFSQPYTLARQLATLDHVSGGRAGWNLVTSSAGAENYGDAALPNHSDRYRRAAEFADVVTRLVESWAPDSVIVDRESGRFADPDKVRAIDHVGEFYRVQGPLNVPRPPQGRPVLVQAGSSAEGQAVGARYADAIFTAQSDSGPAQEFYASIRRQASAAGRNPDHVLILPGLVPIVGDTEADALRIQRDLRGLVDDDYGRTVLSGQLDGVDLTGLDLDAPIPASILPAADEVQGRRSRYEIYYDLTVNRGETLRQLIDRELSANGHWQLVGTAEQVADAIEQRFLQRGADGFNVIPPYSPRGFEIFVDQVIPLLQDRGLFRRDYEETTLRGHLGLPEVPGLRVPRS